MSEQHNDHIWLTVHGENWAIRAIKGKVFHLWRGYEPYLEFTAIEMVNPDWEAYCAAAVKMLKGPVMTHTGPVPGEFTSGPHPSERPCPKCEKCEVVYSKWESKCGGFEDYLYECDACGHTWWVEGPDA